MSFAKLDSGIVNSTLWVQPHDVLRVWIWFLSQADASGMVRTAAPALAHACMVPIDRTREILRLLEAPDPDSRSEAEEGRRIEKVDGGWQIINYRAYRERVNAEEKKENDRVRIAEKRAAERAEAEARAAEASKKVSACREVSRPVASVAEVAQAEAEEEVEAVNLDQELPTSSAPKTAPVDSLPAPASGEAPAADGLLVDPDPIFGHGLAFLLAKGVKERGARSFLGAMRKELGEIVAAELLALAEREDVSDPIPWLRRAGETRRQAPRAGPGHAGQQSPQFALSKTGAAFLALQQRIDRNAELEQQSAALALDGDSLRLPAPARARS